MILALLFLGGATLGFLVGWVLASRRPILAAPHPRASGSGLTDEFLASDTATHIAASVATEQSFDSLAFALLERCETRIGMPCALVMRERSGAPGFVASVSPAMDPRLVGVEVPLESPADRAITDGIPMVGEPDQKVLSIDRRDRRRAVTGGVAVPVSQGPNVVGAVVAFGAAHSGTQDAVAGLSELVRKFGPVLVPAHAVAVATRRANTDELTGLPNRRALNGALQRNGHDRAGLILLDIDHFKLVNDTLGHPAGDIALRHLARILRETLRGRDLAARVGGEEFAVWLPGADLPMSQEVAERLRQRVAASPFRAEGQERALTISCGVAAYPSPIGVVDNLIGAADSALYRAKRGGRNRVETSMEPPTALEQQSSLEPPRAAGQAG